MIEKGFNNVKIISGGGDAAEKFFEYYRSGRIINPITGKVIVIKP
jgi:hypothetical protein